MRIRDWSADVCSSDRRCRSCSSYWTASQRLNRATHVDEACGPPVCIAPGRTMVNHFEPEPREVLSRVEVPTVEASDDRVDALLLFAAVDRRFYPQSRRGSSEARRVGTECVSTGRSRMSPSH